MPTQDQDCSEPGILQFPGTNTDKGLVGSRSASLAQHWFLVHSKPRQESVALVNLERQGYEAYLPMFAVQKIFRRELAVAQEPMFARYLFVRVAPEGLGQSWMQIRSTSGVSKLVRFGDQPARVDDALIRDIRQRESVQKEAPRLLFSSGEKIVITEGSLAGLEAIYHAEDGSGRATVLLEILSRRVTLQVDPVGLRKVK